MKPDSPVGALMTIVIHIPTPLRRYSDQLCSMEVAADSIGDAFEELFKSLPDLEIRLINDRGEIHPYLILLVGDEEIPRDSWRDVALQDGSEIDIVPAVEGGSDVRMRGFKDRVTTQVALTYALQELQPRFETVALSALANRILAEDVSSRVNVPPFDRSAMDGFALHAEDTFGATPYNTLDLRVCGESMPGAQSLVSVQRGQACRIMTGAPMPLGADAVLMAEDCETVGDSLIVKAAVTPGKNVGHVGEDIGEGDAVLHFGRRLRPQDVGLLASIGRNTCRVFSRPRVRILVTGNELLPAGEIPTMGLIVDSNTPMLAALVARDGGELVGRHHLQDDRHVIGEFLDQPDCDILLCAGGTSVGREDFLPLLLAERGEIPIHGIAMRPSAPTGIGRIAGTRVFLLPGNPVSCLCAYDHFAGPALRVLGGGTKKMPYVSVQKVLGRRIASQIGRHDYVRVSAEDDGEVIPIALSGASLLSSTTRATGFVLVDENSEGVDEQESVSVYLYDNPIGSDS